METYVYLVIGPDREILTVKTITVETDALALAHADNLSKQLGIPAYELWRKGNKLAGRYPEGSAT